MQPLVALVSQVFGGTGDPLGDVGKLMVLLVIQTTRYQPPQLVAKPVLHPPRLKQLTFNEMAFVIDRTSVVAKTRALKAEYTSELAQDLKAVHGLDAEVEFANILSAEILAEINREVVRTIYNNAKLAAQQS